MWDLIFKKDIVEYFLDGASNQKRLDMHHYFIKDAELPALQVGVPSTADKKYSPEWTSIDLYDTRPCVDYRMDLSDLKFGDNNFKTIHCCAVLEHVKDPFKCVSEMYRVADKGCKIWVEVPFVQVYHPFKGYSLADGLLVDAKERGDDKEHGGDFWRFTPQGAMQLMKPFKMLDLMLINQGGIVFHGVKESVIKGIIENRTWLVA